LEWKRQVYIHIIWPFGILILGSFGTFNGHLVIYIVAIWYIFLCFGIPCHEKSEKSGNPKPKQFKRTAGLPEFSWHNRPNWGKIYQIAKWP
jgi:hypothetical protein